MSFLYCVQKFFNYFFYGCVDPNRYYYCKGQLWSWLLRLGIQGLTSWGNCGVIFCMGSGAGWIRLFRHAGMGTSNNRLVITGEAGLVPILLAEIQSIAPGWDGGCV